MMHIITSKIMKPVPSYLRVLSQKKALRLTKMT